MPYQLVLSLAGWTALSRKRQSRKARMRRHARIARVVIPGKPFAQPRARTRRGAHYVYDPPTARNWKATAQEHMRLVMDASHAATPFEGPIHLSIFCVFPCPRSRWRKRDRRPREWKEGQRYDVDNLAKSVMDAGNGVLYLDDGQVCSLQVTKIDGAQGEPAKVEVVMTEILDSPEEFQVEDNHRGRAERIIQRPSLRRHSRG